MCIRDSVEGAIDAATIDGSLYAFPRAADNGYFLYYDSSVTVSYTHLDVYKRQAGVSESSKEELKKVAASRANPVQRLIKTLGDIFVPIIPAIVASGFLTVSYTHLDVYKRQAEFLV